MNGPWRCSCLRLLVKTACVGALPMSLAVFSGWASAYDYRSDDGDLAISLGNTVRYTLGWRAQDASSSIANNFVYAQSDRKFDKGDVVTNRVDLLTELNLNYQEMWGARVSAATWYDNAYHDDSVNTPAGMTGSYVGNRYSSSVDRYYNGPSGEILDAFVLGRFDVGFPLDVRLGRMTNYWGENYFNGNSAISYSQSPVDGRKALSNPGIETKEVFMPVGQLSAKAQVTDSLSLAMQYYLEWRPSRVPAPGTFLGPADMLPNDIDQFPQFGFPVVDPKEPSNRGNWGVSARWNVPNLDWTLGFYYRQFDDYNAWTNVQTIGGVPAALRAVYPEDVQLYGVSLAANGPWGSALGAEVSYRKNDALALNDTFTLDGDKGPRGNTWHALANTTWLLGTTPLWESGTLVTELAYSRLDKVTSHPELFKGEGYASCAGQDKSTGCATRDTWATSVSFTPAWLQVVPGIDIEMPTSINYGLHGNGASNSRLAYEGAYTWTAGINVKYHIHTDITLAYNGYHADREGDSSGNGGFSLNDRDWVSLTVKTSF